MMTNQHVNVLHLLNHVLFYSILILHYIHGFFIRLPVVNVQIMLQNGGSGNVEKRVLVQFLIVPSTAPALCSLRLVLWRPSTSLRHTLCWIIFQVLCAYQGQFHRKLKVFFQVMRFYHTLVAPALRIHMSGICGVRTRTVSDAVWLCFSLSFY